MEVQAVAAVVALGQEVGLVGGGREVDRGSLPWIIGEVRVEDVMSGGEGASVLLVHGHRGWPHLLAKDLLALLQMIVQVDGGGAQAASLRCGVEVGHLGAGLVAPGARVALPAGGVSKLLGVVCLSK